MEGGCGYSDLFRDGRNTRIERQNIGVLCGKLGGEIDISDAGQVEIMKMATGFGVRRVI